jgi:hypothetical protein
MACFRVVHLAVTFTVVHDEGEAGFVTRVRDGVSAQEGLHNPVSGALQG